MLHAPQGSIPKAYVPVLWITGLMTMISGCLGFVTSLIRSCLFVGSAVPDDRHLVLVEFGESLFNVAWALVLIMIAPIAVSVGAWRQAMQKDPAPC